MNLLTALDQGLKGNYNTTVMKEEQKYLDEYSACFIEKDPNGLNLKTPGAKADANKAPIYQGVLAYFPRALREVSKTSLAGANKYSWKGWEKVTDGPNRYGDALCRHLLAEASEGEFDRDTGLLHSAQVAWNALARLELILREKEKTAFKPGEWKEISKEEAKQLGLR